MGDAAQVVTTTRWLSSPRAPEVDALAFDDVALSGRPSMPGLRFRTDVPSVSVLDTAREPAGRAHRAPHDGFRAAVTYGKDVEP